MEELKAKISMIRNTIQKEQDVLLSDFNATIENVYKTADRNITVKNSKIIVKKVLNSI